MKKRRRGRRSTMKRRRQWKINSAKGRRGRSALKKRRWGIRKGEGLGKSTMKKRRRGRSALKKRRWGRSAIRMRRRGSVS